MIREAMLYTPLDGGEVSCGLCSHCCRIKPLKFGICGVRQNKNGKLWTHVFGEVIAAHVDPIEKKPVFHFMPGTLSFSIATAGCNFHCPYCQNWQISQAPDRNGGGISGQKLLPDDVVKSAEKYGCRSISYTYTEPTIFFEYAFETARLASAKGLANVFVTNGYMTPETLETISPYLDACNVDLKSFREEFYSRMCKAHLKPVLESIRLMKKLNIWVEVTTLIVPDQNDSEEELSQIADFISSVDPCIPWHISRFHPDYEYTQSAATPVDSLRQASRIGKETGLRYIYIGNVWGESEDTTCPECGKTLIKRKGFSILENRIEHSKCGYCGSRIAGIF